MFPPHHNSDHRAPIVKIWGSRGLKRYKRERTQREYAAKSWIRPGTWALIDRRGSMRKQGTLTRHEGRKLGREVKRAIKADQVERARRAGEAAVLLLTEGKAKESWRTVRGWYRKESERASRPCFKTMEKQTQGREGLYAYREPPRDSIQCNVARPALEDEDPPHKDIKIAVKGCGNGRTWGGLGMRAEDMKAWLVGTEREEKARRDGVEGHEGAEDTWRLFVRLIQHVWDTGEIPRQMFLTIVVLLPKEGDGYRGIGLIEVAWKVIERVLDGRLKGVTLHDALHGFRQKKGCGTGIMESKLIQQPAVLEQCPLYGTFLDLRKAYNAMDRDRCIAILKDCGVGHKIIRLIERFWDQGILVCKSSGCFGSPFKAQRGVTQGGPVSPAIFNLVVDAVVCKWERLLLLEGIPANDVRAFRAVFYADNGLIAARNPKHFQTVIDLLSGLFDRVGLQTNTEKMEVMTFLPGKIQTSLTAIKIVAMLFVIYLTWPKYNK